MATRDALVAEIRDRLNRTDRPRLTVLIILSLAGAAAFVTSVVCLWAGIDSMALRYPLASLAGYLAFVVLIRGWIGICRGEWADTSGDVPNPFDVSDLVDAGARLAGRGGVEGAKAFAGGHSGGGGCGGSWMSEPVEKVASVPQASPAAGETGDGWGISIDLDDGFFFILLAILAALGGLLCLAYVVYIAPVLLAEVALDAALVSAAYGRLRREDVEHWSGAVLRRTLVPAAILVIFMCVTGFAAQQFAPDARSIGGVVRALVS